MSADGKALSACVEYEHWASEVARLTLEIGACECPNESVAEDETHWSGSQSCFTEAKEDRANWTPGGPEHSPGPPTLATLAKIVANCPACSRLCELIAARKHARQRFGVAKRRIRAVGRRARAPESETNPASAPGAGRQP